MYQENQGTVVAWSDALFGRSNAFQILTRVACELVEMMEDMAREKPIKDVLAEAADTMIVYFAYARDVGVNVEQSIREADTFDPPGAPFKEWLNATASLAFSHLSVLLRAETPLGPTSVSGDLSKSYYVHAFPRTIAKIVSALGGDLRMEIDKKMERNRRDKFTVFNGRASRVKEKVA